MAIVFKTMASQGTAALNGSHEHKNALLNEDVNRLCTSAQQGGVYELRQN